MKIMVDKKSKKININTDYDFNEVGIEKFKDYFHINLIKNRNQSCTINLFFNQFGGKKYYPKKINIDWRM